MGAWPELPPGSATAPSSKGRLGKCPHMLKLRHFSGIISAFPTHYMDFEYQAYIPNIVASQLA